MSIQRLASDAIGINTLAVNIIGSLPMGLLIEYMALWGEMAQPWRLFLATGVLGGFTTFSAFSLDAALLYERGQIGLAAAYGLASVVLFIVRQMNGGMP